MKKVTLMKSIGDLAAKKKPKFFAKRANLTTRFSSTEWRKRLSMN